MRSFYLFLFFIFLSSCVNQSDSLKIEVSKSLFLFQKPSWSELEKTNFPVDLIYPSSKIVYFVHLERTGIWQPDQYALLLEVDHSENDKVLNFYKKILIIKEWQILQSKQIQDNDRWIYFLNAQDFFNRNLSIVIEKTKKTIIKIYLKKLTDE